MGTISVLSILVIIFTLGNSALALWRDWNKKRSIHIILAVIIAAFSIIIIYLNSLASIHDKMLRAYDGVLKPANGIKYSSMVLECGNALLPVRLSEEFIIPDSAFIIRLIGGHIMITTRMFDSNGKLLASLFENEWKVASSSSWDRNYTQNALEIINDKGEVALQVRIKEDTVQFQGKFYDASGYGLTMYSRDGAAVMDHSGKSMNNVRFVPLFKYPSSLHFGQFAR